MSKRIDEVGLLESLLPALDWRVFRLMVKPIRFHVSFI